MISSSRGAAGRRRCPICGAPTLAAMRPFCSKRCADVDLGRWLDGEYRIPTHDDGGDDGEAGATHPPDDDDEGSSGTRQYRGRPVQA